jgi:hypothetical protein
MSQEEYQGGPGSLEERLAHLRGRLDNERDAREIQLLNIFIDNIDIIEREAENDIYDEPGFFANSVEELDYLTVPMNTNQHARRIELMNSLINELREMGINIGTRIQTKSAAKRGYSRSRSRSRSRKGGRKYKKSKRSKRSKRRTRKH